VPTMIHRLVEADPATLGAVRELQQISYGGAPIAPVLFRTAIERLGPCLLQVYGSSEAPHPITLLRPADYLDDPSDELLMSAGYPAFAAEVRTVADDGSVAATGELQVRAAHVMSGYWRNPEATQAAFTEDGWYATGDLASMDELGLVTFRDRKRDLIISGGMNVYPSEVERVLHDHPAVSQAVVVGCPDEEWGESVFAYVVARSGTPVTESELTDWVRDRLAGYKKPRYYEFRSELTMGSSQKVLRNVLRDELWVDRDRRV
jgi:acyl-CoA synthetase (AMP-forming)/AMP-acid ligase II